MTPKEYPIEVPTKVGYTFGGYYTDLDGKGTQLITKEGYVTSDFTNTIYETDTILHAKWTINKVKITYNIYNGTIEPTTTSKNKWSIDKYGKIKKNDKIYETIINYGEKTGENGLINYNNNEYKITRVNNHCSSSHINELLVRKDKEWKLLDKTTGKAIKTYSQKIIYKAIDFCDLKTKSCNIELYLNWYDPVLDLNALVNNKIVQNIRGFGTADIYINGTLTKNNVDDYCVTLTPGTKYKITDIKGNSEWEYTGKAEGVLEGIIGEDDSNTYLIFEKK